MNNTHLAEETTVELVQAGARGVTEAAEKMGLPVIATAALKEIAAAIGQVDCVGNPVWPLERFMPRAFW